MFSNNLLMAAAGGGGADYVIENSLIIDRDSSAYMSKTYSGGDGNLNTWVYSGWIKRGALGHTDDSVLFGAGITATGYFTQIGIRDAGTDEEKLLMMIQPSGSTSYGQTISAVLRDTAAWYHVCVAVDTTQATAADRIRFWINGVAQTSVDLYTGYPDQNQDLNVGDNTYIHYFGKYLDLAQYYDGYFAQTAYLDGLTITDPTTDGLIEVDANGYIIPADISGLSYGTTGVLLEYGTAPGTGNGGGTDTSGLDNHYTDSGLTASDQVSDSPTNDADNGIGNFSTLNPLQKNANLTLNEGNLKASPEGSNNQDTMTSSTIVVPSGSKMYAEFTVTGSNTGMVGVQKANEWGADYDVMPDDSMRILHIATGDVYSGDGVIEDSNYAPNDTVPVTLMVAVDLENDNMYIGDASTDKWSDGSGTYDQDWSGSPGAISLPADLNWKFVLRLYNATQVVNFGATAFTGTKPTGYSTLATQTMPTPTIPDPTEHHQVELVNHDGSSTAFTCNWDADTYDTLFIIKNRDSVEKWYWVDGLNGYNKYTSSDQNTAQTTDANVVTVSGTTITLGSTLAADNYVVECHKAGLAGGASNSDGTITSTVSANITSGFSIILWTGTQANATIGHGLDSAPEFTTGFKILGGEGRWGQHIGLTSGVNSIRIDTTGAQVSGSTQWNSTFPSSTVISLGSSNATNFSGAMMMYAWHGVEGYSAFGSYEGNSNEDGPMVLTNMKPTLIMLKPVDAVENWTIWDTQRASYNVSGARLYPNSTVAEEGTVDLDILSNGFKLRNAGGNQNPSSTVVYSTWGGRPIQGTGDGSTSQGRAR